MKLFLIKYRVILIVSVLALSSYLGVIAYNHSEREKKFKISYELFKQYDYIDIVNLEPLSKAGHGKSNYLMGLNFYRKGNTVEALKYFNSTKESGESVLGGFGVSFCSNQSVWETWVKKNASEILKMAEDGDWYWQYWVARFITWGWMPNNKDQVKAFNLMLASAEQGCVTAEVGIGKYYFYGTGTKEDNSKAADYFIKAEKKNFSEGEYWVGFFIEQGITIKASDTDALPYYKRAAAKGNADAAYRIALFYEAGRGGVQSNMSEAIKWAKVSLQNGCQSAKQLIEEYENKQRMASMEETMAQRRASTSSSNSYENIPTCYCKWCNRSFSATKMSGYDQAMMNLLAAQGEAMYGLKGKIPTHECADYCSRRCEVEASYNR